jgi:hypothetical protein
LYNSGSNFRSLSQGVDAATQNNIFSPEAVAAAAVSALLRSASFPFVLDSPPLPEPPPNAVPPVTPKAAAAPTDPKNVRRVCICPSPIRRKSIPPLSNKQSM